jgi:pimeloyl-ACP methyl ester carboxylesterase
MKININGLKFAYAVRGRTGPPLVLLHGFAMDRSIWVDLVESQLGDQQVILPDLRGHGESDAPEGPYSMSLMAADLAYLLDALGIEQAIVCGHSMGGYVALAFAEHHPHKLAGLGLITTNAQADPAEKRAGRFTLIDQIRERGALAVAESLAPRLSSNPAVVGQAQHLICSITPQGLIGALLGMAERPDRTAQLPQVNVPALVVAGEADQITDFASAKAMADALPQGEFLGIPGVGHLPMSEAAVELGQGLRSLVVRVNDYLDHIKYMG